MPFESEKQRKWMWANKPKMAKRWEAHTPQSAVSHKDRYDTDHEYRRQVDEARRRSAQERSTRELQRSLDMVKNRKKHY